tara:strand:- start:144 stop:854 length:711 start_codon:yes stop_codon:yes gene_type:complete
MSIAPMQRPMPETMGTGFGLNLPFTRTPQERMIEGYERKKEMEGKIKEKAGKVVDAIRGTGAARLAGSVGGGMAGSKAGAALGGSVGGPAGAVVGSVAGSLIGSTVGEKTGEAIGGMREKRMAGDMMRTAFGGGAITGDSADRRSPTEEMVMGNPMASPFAADSVRMPQDLQAGYMHMNRFGSPLPIHGLGTPGRTSMAQDIQDGNLVMQHRMQVANRDPVSMSRLNMIGGMGDFS